MRNSSALRVSTPSLALATLLSFAPALVRAQTAAAASASLLPGPKPPDVSDDWKNLVGVYGSDKLHTLTVLERDGRLYLHAPFLFVNEESDIQIQKKENSVYLDPVNNIVGFPLLFSDRPNGPVTLITYLRQPPPSRENDPNSQKSYRLNHPGYLPRADAGSDPSHFFHVNPTRPLEQLRTDALRASPPPEQGPFRGTDLVELATLDPAIHLDIRYAQSNNFLSTPIYSQARAFLQRPAAEALLRALHKLQPLGYGLLIHDAYRPWYVTKIFWDATPLEGHKFVADPAKGSKHNRGCAVDLTLYDLATGKAIQMPGLYDEMSPRSYPTFSGGTSLQRWHRDLLRRTMESEGFTVNEDEWWHFDYQDWKHYAIGNAPFENLGKQ